MKTTDHFKHRAKQRDIDPAWCRRVVRAPIEMQQQENGYYRFWGFIEETGKVLRVVLLEDRKTFHTAFWDSGYRGRQ